MSGMPSGEVFVGQFFRFIRWLVALIVGGSKMSPVHLWLNTPLAMTISFAVPPTSHSA